MKNIPFQTSVGNHCSVKSDMLENTTARNSSTGYHPLYVLAVTILLLQVVLRN